MNEDSELTKKDLQIMQLNIDLKQASRMNEEMNENLNKQIGLLNERINGMKSEMLKIETEKFEKEIEIKYLRDNIQRNSELTIINDICTELGCITKDEILQKISDMKHENLRLLTQLNSGLLNNCDGCKVLSERLDYLKSSNEEKVSNIILEHEKEMTDMRISMKSTLLELNEMKEKIGDLVDDNDKLISDNEHLKEEIIRLNKDYVEEKENRMIANRRIREIENVYNRLESESQLISHHHDELAKKDEICTNVLNTISMEIHNYQMNNPFLEALSQVLDVLTTPENSITPDTEHIKSLLQTVNTGPSFDHISRSVRQAEIRFSSYMKGMKMKMLQLNENIDRICKKATNAVKSLQDDIEEKKQIIEELQMEDLAPKVSALMSRIKELEQQKAISQVGAQENARRARKPLSVIGSPGEDVFDGIIKSKANPIKSRF